MGFRASSNDLRADLTVCIVSFKYITASLLSTLSTTNRNLSGVVSSPLTVLGVPISNYGDMGRSQPPTHQALGVGRPAWEGEHPGPVCQAQRIQVKFPEKAVSMMAVCQQLKIYLG